MTRCAAPHCNQELAGRSDRAYCSDACRQASYRHRQRRVEVERAGLAALQWMVNLPASRNTTTDASRNGVRGHPRSPG